MQYVSMCVESFLILKPRVMPGIRSWLACLPLINMGKMVDVELPYNIWTPLTPSLLNTHSHLRHHIPYSLQLASPVSGTLFICQNCRWGSILDIKDYGNFSNNSVAWVPAVLIPIFIYRGYKYTVSLTSTQAFQVMACWSWGDEALL